MKRFVLLVMVCLSVILMTGCGSSPTPEDVHETASPTDEVTKHIVSVTCPTCNGSGELGICDFCEGRGYRAEKYATGDISEEQRAQYMKEDCPACGGTGKKTCVSCNGKGVIRKIAVEESPTDEATTIPEQFRCQRCGGDGIDNCGSCGGRGYNEAVKYGSPNSPSAYLDKEECLRCNGTGKVTCVSCGGTGVKKR